MSCRGGALNMLVFSYGVLNSTSSSRIPAARVNVAVGAVGVKIGSRSCGKGRLSVIRGSPDLGTPPPVSPTVC